MYFLNEEGSTSTLKKKFIRLLKIYSDSKEDDMLLMKEKKGIL